MASISVLYEDNHLIIINKPPGALVQADKTGDQPITNDVKAYIKAHYDKPGDVFLGVIHRIDRPVSGVVIFARTSKALERMNEMFKNREVQKTYWAVTGKIPNPTEGVLKHYTIKDSERHKAKIFPKEMPDSKACELSYRLIAESERYFLLEVEPKTGRYHQIRAQLSYIGCPIKGDIKYNWPRTNEDGSIHLHARSVTFIHPVKKTPLTVTAPVPDTDAVWKYFASL